MQIVIDYIMGLGSNVFVPIVLVLLGLLFGLSFLKSLKTGITVGVGFLGLGLVISIISSGLTPAVNLIVERFDLSLRVIDVGSGAAAGVGFSTVVGALIIPFVFALNIILLATGLTKTMNIDIFNYSHYALTGSVVWYITQNLTLGLVAGLFHAIFSLISADYTAKNVQEVLGLDGISIPQGYASSTVPLYTILNKIYDKIPFIKNSKVDDKALQKKMGMIGDPVIIGVFLGVILGVMAGYGFKEISNLVIVVCGLMILFPRMIKIIVEGLLPISEAAKVFFNKRFKGKQVYIGLDSAITLGHPTTMTVGIILIPITLILAAILPGNKVLPLADLPFAPFFICMATILHKGNVLKTLISSTINMIIILYVATWFSPYFTEISNLTGLNPDKTPMSALYIGNIFDFIITKLNMYGILGIAVLFIIAVVSMIYVKKTTVQKEN
jgi:PTS system galactitol-specific IIC component